MRIAHTRAAVALTVICVWTSATALAADKTIPSQPAPAPATTVEISLDAVYATRGHSSNDLLIEDTVTGASALSAGSFGNGWEPGADARLRLGQGPVFFEARYFGGFDFSASTDVVTPAIWNFPTNPPLFGLGVANVEAIYKSRFNAFEANMQWRSHPQITYFVGARIVDIREELIFAADFEGNQADITTDTRFTAAGPQIGAIWRAFGSQQPAPGTFFLDIDGRFAWLYAASEAGFGVAQSIGPAFNSFGNYSYWTYLAEAGVKAGFAFGPNAEAHIGYRILYVGDVPLAPAQVAATQVLFSRIGKTTDAYWIHGVNAGFVVRF